MTLSRVTVVQLGGYSTSLITKGLDRWPKNYHFTRQHQVPQHKPHMWLVMALGAIAGRLWTSLPAVAVSLGWFTPLWTPYKRPGRQFATDHDMKQAITSWLQTIYTDFLYDGIQALGLPLRQMLNYLWRLRTGLTCITWYPRVEVGIKFSACRANSY